MTFAWTLAEALRRRRAKHAAAAMLAHGPRGERPYREASAAFEAVPRRLRGDASALFDREHVCPGLDRCPLRRDA